MDVLMVLIRLLGGLLCGGASALAAGIQALTGPLAGLVEREWARHASWSPVLTDVGWMKIRVVLEKFGIPAGRVAVRVPVVCYGGMVRDSNPVRDERRTPVRTIGLRRIPGPMRSPAGGGSTNLSKPSRPVWG